MKANIYFFTCLLLLSLTACTNQFKYEKNDWAYVTETTQGEKETAYIDKNRIECKDGQCRTWVKMVFNNDQVVPYSGDEKKGTKSGYLMVKRVDSSVDYDCTRGTVRMNSYQLYDGDKLIDTKWVKSDIEYARPGTVHYDLWKYVCGEKKN